MSTGGTYTLLVNSGVQQDRILLATDLLSKRLVEIKRIRGKRPDIKDSLPTLIDIERTHILYITSHFKPFVAIGYEYQKISAQQGLLQFGNTLTFSIPQFGDFWNDMVMNFNITGLIAPPGQQVRYCEYLAHRLVQLVQFEVNGNAIDKYGSEVINMHYQFMVNPGRRVAWNRMVGQETPVVGYLQQNIGVDSYRQYRLISTGLQTPKSAHPVASIWLPLLFWFNKDPRLSVPSIAIPYGQRFIKITLAPIELLAQNTVGIASDFTTPTIVDAEMYINNIFINQEIHELFIKRVGFSLIRAHRIQTFTIDTPTSKVLLNELKWPIETIYVGLKPDINISSMENWYKFNYNTELSEVVPIATINPAPPPNNFFSFGTAKYQIPNRVIDTLSVEAQGVILYPTFPAEFYNNYIPYNYISTNMNTPEDIGALMITFNLYPGMFQPSGYINLSRAKELYIGLSSSIVGTRYPLPTSPIVTGVLHVIAIAINFVICAEGTFVLRYNI